MMVFERGIVIIISGRLSHGDFMDNSFTFSEEGCNIGGVLYVVCLKTPFSRSMRYPAFS